MAILWVRHAPASAAVARHHISTVFMQAGLTADEAFDAALIASELVGNAVRHGLPLPSGQIGVEWSLDGSSYRISVTDGGNAQQIEPKRADAQQTSGRGLMIVAAVAREWGVLTDGPTTTVWAICDLPPTAERSTETADRETAERSAESTRRRGDDSPLKSVS